MFACEVYDIGDPEPLCRGIFSTYRTLPTPNGRLDPQRPTSLRSDLAAHDEFPNEWWYGAGLLKDEEGTPYAFHLSFFKHWAEDERRFGIPLSWVDNPGRFAHGMLTNLASGQRFIDEMVGLARRGTGGAHSDRYYFWTGNWSARGTESGSHRVNASLRRTNLDLEFKPRKPRKPLVVHAGDGAGRPPSVGKSQSYYLPLLDAHGHCRNVEPLRREKVSVNGEGWFDYEIMEMDVALGARGWDWFALQLDDGSELVVY